MKENIMNQVFDISALELQTRLEAVQRQSRRARAWWLWTGIVASSIVLTALGMSLIRREMATPWTVIQCAAAWTLLAGVWFAWRGRGPLNAKAMANRIESKFPDLDQRLITAVSSGDPDSEGEPNYFTRRLIQEANEHAGSHAWASVVPRWRWRVGRFLGVAGALLWMGMLGWIAREPAPSTATASVPAVRLPDVDVQPGDVELRRGTNLLVTATFGPSGLDSILDSEPMLVLVPDGEEQRQRRVGMRQALDDPTWAGLITEVDQSASYRVVTTTWSSPTFRVDVFELPRVEQIDATLTFPVHTKMDERLIQDVSRIAAVKNTEVSFRVILNKPVQRAFIRWQSGDEQDMVAVSDDARIVMATHRIVTDEKATFQLIDKEDRVNESTVSVVIRALPNQPPKIELETSGDAVASPLQELPVRAKVTDDLAVMRRGLTFRLEDGQPQEVVFESNEGSREESVFHQFDFEALNAQPDQFLAYHLWAEDVDADGQVRRTDGDLYFVEVRPFEEIYREGQSQPPGQAGSPQMQQAGELIELQKQVIQATWNLQRRGPDDEALLADLAVIRQAQKDALAQLEELASKVSDSESAQTVDQIQKAMSSAIGHLQSDDLAGIDTRLGEALVDEQAAMSGLLRLRAREFQVAKQRRQQGQGSGSRRQNRKLNELELDQEESRYETQSEAASPQEQAARQDRQSLSRLRELAKRQQDLNDELAAMQSAMQTAPSDSEKQEIARQLQRLREQQRDVMRDMDELAEQMQASSESSTRESSSSPSSSETAPSSRDSKSLEQSLSEARDSMQQSSQSMQDSEVGSALANGRRAQDSLEAMKDDLQQRTSNAFQEQLRQLRDQTERVQQRQDELTQTMEELGEPQASAGLRQGDDRGKTEAALREQARELEALLESLQATVEDAEVSQPLLAQELYQAVQSARRDEPIESLDQAAEMVRRGFDEPAAQTQRATTPTVRRLARDVQEAAEEILGNESDGLRQAMEELERLERQLVAEVNSNRPSQDNDTRQDSNAEQDEDGNQSSQPSSAAPRDSQSSSEQEPRNPRGGEGQSQADPSQAGPSQSDPSPPSGGPSKGNAPSGQPSDGQREGGSGSPSSSPSSRRTPGLSSPSSNEANDAPAGGQQPGLRQTGGQQTGNQQSGGQQVGGARTAAAAVASSPIAGEGFREWSDSMRDVEELVGDQDLRSRATQIRQRVRDARAEFIRHSKEPQWDLVDEMIVGPLRQLREDVAVEFLRATAEDQRFVPLDREPVPQAFQRSVDEYFERLGSVNESTTSATTP